jgi:protease-4
VWSGADAIKINLVDELGGINDAIVYAAKQAKLKEYELMNLPKQKDPLQELLSNTQDEMEARTMKSYLGEQYIYMKHLKNVLQLKGVQARLPYEMIIE